MSPDSGQARPDQEREPPQASIHVGSKRRFSLIWAIPIVTAMIGVYLAVDTVLSRGPTIVITFQTAEGLQAGKSVVKQKDVEIGLVKTVRVSPDNTHVEVTVQMQPEAKRLLTDGAKFWVVKARIFAGAISGLETLLSGAYIEMLPGGTTDGAKPVRAFAGLEDPPVLQSDVPGRTLLVTAQRIGSISLGSPVFYRDLVVGQVLGYDVADMAESVTLHVFVRSPFDAYVHDNSNFWNASGFSANLTSNGLQLQVQSLRAVLLGGVAFDTPPNGHTLNPDKPTPNYTLYQDHDAAIAATYGRREKFVAYFSGSVRGLSVGADVELRGLKIGQVTGVYLRYDPEKDQVVVPVEFEVQPQRITGANLDPRGNNDETVRDLVHRGMRAQLVSANLVTGAQLITLDTVPNAPPAEVTREGDKLVIPTLAAAGFDNIARSASDILGRVNAIPFDQIGAHLNGALAGVDALANGPQLRAAVSSLNDALRAVRDLTAKLNDRLPPALDRFPQIAAGLQESVTRVNKALASADQSYGGDSRFSRDLTDTLAQLNDTARSIRALADLLSRHPEALIRGRTDRGVN